MKEKHDLSSLAQLLRRISAGAGRASPKSRVQLKTILDHVGRRSFAPLLLFAGLVTSAPLVGDIPGVPTTIGLFVVLTAGQLLIGRQYFWLPAWILKRSIERKKITKALSWMRPVARFIDRWTRPRLTILTGRAGLGAIALVSTVIGLAMPAMELVPFSAQIAGAALMILGLSLVAHDGVLALLGFVVSASLIGLLAYNLL